MDYDLICLLELDWHKRILGFSGIHLISGTGKDLCEYVGGR